jgi:predicted GNAT family N-acyltransferase
MIKEFTIGKEKEIQYLIKSVFDDFVGYEYSAEGNKFFNDFIDSEQIINRYKRGNIILTYEENENIIGVIEVKDNNHICLFFVNKAFHNMGVGRILFNSILERVKGKTDFIEVNASPFSEKIYAKLGFTKLSEMMERNGIKYIPMIFVF